MSSLVQNILNIGGLIALFVGGTVYVGNVKSDVDVHTTQIGKHDTEILAISAGQEAFEQKMDAQYLWITQALYEIAKTQGARVEMPPVLSTTTSFKR